MKEALSGTLSPSELCKKHSIPHLSQIHRWIRIFAPQFKHDPMKDPLSVSPEEEIARLKRALQQKELELNRERMRAGRLHLFFVVSFGAYQ